MRISDWGMGEFVTHLVAGLMGVFVFIVLVNAIFPRPLIEMIRWCIYVPAGLLLIYMLIKNFIEDIKKYVNNLRNKISQN